MRATPSDSATNRTTEPVFGPSRASCLKFTSDWLITSPTFAYCLLNFGVTCTQETEACKRAHAHEGGHEQRFFFSFLGVSAARLRVVRVLHEPEQVVEHEHLREGPPR